MSELDPREPHSVYYVGSDGKRAGYWADGTGVIQITEEALHELLTLAGFKKVEDE